MGSVKLSRLDWALALGTLALDVLLLVLPPGGAILDARLYYSVAEASEFLAALGTSGTQQYVVHQYLDLLFIASYSCLLCRLARRWAAQSSQSWATHVPWYAPAIFDLSETVAIILALREAGPHSVLLSVASFSTPAKWAALLLTLGNLARVYWKARRARAGKREVAG